MQSDLLDKPAEEKSPHLHVSTAASHSQIVAFLDPGYRAHILLGAFHLQQLLYIACRGIPQVHAATQTHC